MTMDEYDEYRQNEIRKLKLEIRDLVLEALQCDGEHHKQWYLAQVLEAVMDDHARRIIETIKWTWDEGIAP